MRFPFCRLALSVFLFSVHVAHADTQDDRRLQSDVKIPDITPPIDSALPIPPQPANAMLSVDEQMLLANPTLLSRAMLSVLVANDVAGTQLLLPIYQKQPSEIIESEMVDWGSAVLAGAKSRHDQASKIYQSLHDQYPNNTLFAVRLIQSLFANRQYLEAKQLLAEQPDYIVREMRAYQKALTNLTKPSAYFSGNVIVDKNINNAPNQTDLGGGWTANAAEQAHGIAINAGVEKKILFKDGVTIEPSVTMNGKLFRDAKHYNETQLRLGVNTIKNHTGGSVSISPFVETSWYAGGKKGVDELKHFSDTLGVSIGSQSQLGKKSQLATNIEFAKHHHNIRHHLSGHSVSAKATFSTRPNWLGESGWVSVGADYRQAKTRDKDDSYTRVGIQGSITKRWHDLGVRGSLNFSQRRYHGPMPIFNQTQTSDEYFTNISVWHNKLSYLGLTPKLTWQYQKNDSNIALYSYDKSRVFLEVSRQF